MISPSASGEERWRVEVGRSILESKFEAFVVWLIADGKAERALELLAKRYHVSVPRLKVGLPKGRKKGVLGCYTANTETISVLNSETLKNPFVILHEFYHHLRTMPDLQHRGTERNANEFAGRYMREYRDAVAGLAGND